MVRELTLHSTAYLGFSTTLLHEWGFMNGLASHYVNCACLIPDSADVECEPPIRELCVVVPDAFWHVEDAVGTEILGLDQVHPGNFRRVLNRSSREGAACIVFLDQAYLLGGSGTYLHEYLYQGIHDDRFVELAFLDAVGKVARARFSRARFEEAFRRAWEVSRDPCAARPLKALVQLVWRSGSDLSLSDARTGFVKQLKWRCEGMYPPGLEGFVNSVWWFDWYEARRASHLFGIAGASSLQEYVSEVANTPRAVDPRVFFTFEEQLRGIDVRMEWLFQGCGSTFRGPRERALKSARLARSLVFAATLEPVPEFQLRLELACKDMWSSSAEWLNGVLASINH